MPPYFQINFRREAFKRERERSRRRLLAIAAWATYFGVAALLIGLYVLNLQTVQMRADALEHQVSSARHDSTHSAAWQPGATEAEFVRAQRQSTRLLSRRLDRLARLLPPNAALTSVAENPNNLADASAKSLLVITGTMRTSGGEGGMRSVVQMVSTLSSDSVFARGFSSIQLASSQAMEKGPPAIQFVVECR
jgi:hypothetical protein